MAFIDFVEWTPTSNDVFAWKFPEDNLSTATQLIVKESQEAVLFSKGQIIAKFSPGRHTLSTQNIPLLRSLFGVPFGGKNPFLAQVWFVNKVAPLTIDWTTTTMRVMDPDYNAMIPLVAKGRYGLKVSDAERFLIKLVGTLTEFNTRSLTDHFMGALVAKTNSCIVSYMTGNGVGINKIAAYLEQLSEFLKSPLKEFWEDYGIALTGFYITSIDVDESSPDGKKIASAISDRSAQGIAGYTWQQNKAFSVAGDAVSGSNGASSLGMLPLMMMMGGNGMGQAMMTPNTGMQSAPMAAPNFAAGAPGMGLGGGTATGIKEVFCSNCGKKYKLGMKFCPYCGDRYNPCPVCGADNADGATRCVRCGAALAGAQVASATCPRCNSPVAPGLKFCPNCGGKL